MPHLLGREQSVPLHKTIAGRQKNTEYPKWRQDEYCYSNELKKLISKIFGYAPITYEMR